MTAYMWSRGIAPLILDLGTNGTEWPTLGLGRFNPEKEPQNALNTRRGGPRAGLGVLERKNIS